MAIYSCYISARYCQLGEYILLILPTTLHKNLKKSTDNECNIFKTPGLAKIQHHLVSMKSCKSIGIFLDTHILYFRISWRGCWRLGCLASLQSQQITMLRKKCLDFFPGLISMLLDKQIYIKRSDHRPW